MFVLISFGLVLVATVLLVLGLVADSGLSLIYVSIACSLAAGIILVVATRVNRPRADSAAAAPSPLPAPEPPVVPAAVAAAASSAPADEEFAPAAEQVAAAAAATDEMFPIADYEDLSVGEIVPLLPKLYADEIDVVEARERSGKKRRQILARLGELRDSMEGAPDDLTAEEWAEQRPTARARRAPVKKAADKAAPAKRATAPAKKAAAKKAAPTKRATAPAKKAIAKKAAPAKKAVAKKAAAPVTKAAKAAKKATKKR